MAKTIDQQVEKLFEDIDDSTSNADTRELLRTALLAVARDQQERDQAALGTVPQTVINGVGMISTKEAATAIRNQTLEGE